MKRFREMTREKALQHKEWVEHEAARQVEELEVYTMECVAENLGLSRRQRRTLRALARRMRPLLRRRGNPTKLDKLGVTAYGLVQEWVIKPVLRRNAEIRAAALAEEAK